MQNYLFDRLMAAGRDHGLRPFGIRAMDSLRIEKSYRLIPRELSIEYAALESGLHRFVHLNKGSFIGRDALVEWQQRGFSHAFATLEVHGVTDADARGSEPIYAGGELAGRATSGGPTDGGLARASPSRWCARTSPSRRRRSRSRSSASAGGPR